MEHSDRDRLTVVERDLHHVNSQLETLWRKVEANTDATTRNTMFVKSAMAVVSALIVITEVWGFLS